MIWGHDQKMDKNEMKILNPHPYFLSLITFLTFFYSEIQQAS